MALVYRLIVGALLALVGAAAFAAFPLGSEYKVSNSPAVRGYFPTPQGACEDFAAYSNTVGSAYDWAFTSATTAQCKLTGTRKVAPFDTSLGVYTMASRARASCPAGSTGAGGSCACTPPMVEDATHTFCVADKSRWEKACEDNIGKRYDWWVKGKGAVGGCQTGINLAGSPIEGDTGGLNEAFGCAVRFVDDDSKISTQDSDGQWTTRGEVRVTGGTCVQSGTEVPSDAPEDTKPEDKGDVDKCPGGDAGSVNGQEVCVPHVPNAGIEGTDTSKVTNPDGSSVETRQEVKCDAGRCTTTTTTTTRSSTGTVTNTSTSTKEESIGSKCETKPDSKVCTTTGVGGGGGGGKGGGSFGGDCVAGYKAQGEDPVLNAMALEQYKRNCQVFDTNNETSKWVEQERDRTDDRTADNPHNSTVTFSSADIDTSDALGAGAHCIADKTITVGGASVALPLSKVCGSLDMLGLALLGVSFLLGARIVMRG